MKYHYEEPVKEGEEFEHGGERKSLLSRASSSSITMGTDDDDSDSATSSIESYFSNGESAEDNASRFGIKKEGIIRLVVLLVLFLSLNFLLSNHSNITNHKHEEENKREGEDEVGIGGENSTGNNNTKQDYDDYSLYDVSYVNLMRHGEKDESSGVHLSKIGIDRSEYYSRCMNNPTPTKVVPKPIGTLMAQLNATISPSYKGNDGLSQRSADTLIPLSIATGIPINKPCKITDIDDCLMNEIYNKTTLLQPNTTNFIVWEHKLFPKLLRKLLNVEQFSTATSGIGDDERQRQRPLSVLETQEGIESIKSKFHKWPEACDAQTWSNPRRIKPGKENNIWNGTAFPYHDACFDIVWQIKYVSLISTKNNNNNNNNNNKLWIPVEVKQINNGYGGSSVCPCAEGLAPIY